MQGAQDILQLLTLSVEDMTQRKLFHRNGRDDHGQSFFPGHVCPVGGKGRHRHIQKLHSSSRTSRDGDVRQDIQAAFLPYDSRDGSVPVVTEPASGA